MALTRQDKDFQSFVDVDGTTARRVYTVNPVQLLFSGGINPRGAYDNLTTYSTGDLVTYLGSSYVAIQETTGNLPTDQTYWQISAEKGDVGETGEQGDSGGIFEHVLLGETFVIQERTQALLIDKLRNEGKITVNGRLILRN